MRRLFAALMGLALLLALGATLAAALTPRPPSTVELAREAAALEALARAEARAEALEPVHTLVAAAWALLPLVAAAGLLAWLAALGVAALARFRRERRPDARGLVALPVEDVPQAGRAALAAFHAAQVERARTPAPVPVTYSPSISYAPSVSDALTYSPHHRTDRALGSGPALLPADTAAEPVAAPAFAELLTTGRVGLGPDGRALPLVLGFDAESGAELVGSWLDLYSTAVAGLPGAGKTTTQRFLACQTALMGARFVVVDPHAEAGADSLAATLDPLRAAYLCDAASDDAAILAAVRLVADIGERRVKGLDPDTTPVILWADELTKLLGRSTVGPELGQLLEAVAQEYRKKRVFVCGSGQIWTAARTGSELRDSFASAIVHRMKRNQARMLLPTEEAAQAERLDTGRAILWRTSGATATVAIPLTTGEDVRRVGALLAGAPQAAGDASAGPMARPFGFRPQAATAPAAGARPGPGPESGPGGASASGRATATLDPEAARLLAKFAAGASVHDLAAELAGTTNPGDRRYKAARAQVEALLRQLAEGGRS